jgi:copper transport protein
VVRAIALALVALALLPASALAHATLQQTVPQRGAKLDKPPAQVTFRFDESVEASFGALRIFDSKGREVQTGKAFHPGGKGADIAVKLKPGLGDGTYTATYRVVSADGHVVSSGFVFTVGEASAPAESLDQLLATGSKSGKITTAALGVARALQYAAIALGLGTLIFFLACWRRLGVTSRPFIAKLERLLLVAGILGVVSAIAALALQGAVGEGATFWSAARPDTIKEVLGTRFGRAWGIGAALWIVALIVLATKPLRPRGEPRIVDPAPPGEPALVLAGGADGGGSARATDSPAPAGAAVAVAGPATAAPARAAAPVSTPHLVALSVPLFALVLLPSFGGHASVQSPVAILLPANLLHVLAMSAWLGGIAVLVFALRAATSELEPDQRTPLLAGVVGRFSAIASIALPVLLLSGVVQAIVEVRSFPALLDSAFGRAVLIKVMVAVGIIALGYINRQEILPELRKAAAEDSTPGKAGVLLRRTLRLEFLLGLTAIAVTGALSSYAPSVAESSGPYATTTYVGPARLEVTVDPAKVGPNQLHLYLFDRKTGAAFEQTKELNVTAAMPSKNVPPLTLNSHVAGPGHYVVDGATLSVRGNWTISVTDRVSDFDQYQTHFTVPIK